MAENKTIPTELSVQDYLEAIEHPQRKEDCIAINDLMERITGKKAKMWGKTIVGFGTYHYTYESGREGDFFKVGFSNRKQSITLYIMGGFKKHDELLSKVGPHKTGKSCFYIKRLSEMDIDILSALILESIKAVESKYTILD